MANDFNLAQLKLVPSTAQVAVSSATKPVRHRRSEKFLKGPVPLNWLAAAGRQPGKALHVGIVLWFQSGLKVSRTVALSSNVLRSFDVDRHAGYRGLKALERAGLVSVFRHP